MNKRPKTQKINDKRTNAIEAIQTTELGAVTGGCSRCGCGQPDPIDSQQQLAAGWLRR